MRKGDQFSGSPGGLSGWLGERLGRMIYLAYTIPATMLVVLVAALLDPQGPHSALRDFGWFLMQLFAVPAIMALASGAPVLLARAPVPNSDFAWHETGVFARNAAILCVIWFAAATLLAAAYGLIGVSFVGGLFLLSAYMVAPAVNLAWLSFVRQRWIRYLACAWWLGLGFVVALAFRPGTAADIGDSLLPWLPIVAAVKVGLLAVSIFLLTRWKLYSPGRIGFIVLGWSALICGAYFACFSVIGIHSSDRTPILLALIAVTPVLGVMGAPIAAHFSGRHAALKTELQEFV